MDIKLFIIALALLVLVLLYLRYQKQMVAPLMVALCIAVIWTSYFRYEYNGNNIFLLNRINIFPLVLWTVSLTGIHLTSLAIHRKYRLPIAIILYFVALGIIELIGYHVVNIRLNSNYTSLLGLGVIHAPTTMKVFYVLAGPLYLLVVDRYTKQRAWR